MSLLPHVFRARRAPLAALALSGLTACASGVRPATAPAPSAAPVTTAAGETIATRASVPAGKGSTPTTRGAASAAADATNTRPAHWHTPGTVFDLDVHEFESQERVARYVRLFSGPARASFAEQLERGTRYEGMIRGRLRAAGLPEDMYFLALVESGFDPQATSRASAVGMWQFMAATARDVGMRVDYWVDERRDPFRATDGAVRTMRWLRSQFGSMFLAAAAYNGGEGRVSRGLARLASADSARADSEAVVEALASAAALAVPLQAGGEDAPAPSDTEHAAPATGDGRFFALANGGYLRDETKNYVPQLIAALLVAKEPSRYGLVVHAREPLEYDSVRVDPLVPLAAVAEAAGIGRETMLDLNPHYLRGVTPPGAASWVRVPAGASATTARRLRAMPASDLRAFRRATTHKRDTYADIAEREGVPARLVTRYNADLATAHSGKWKGRIIGGQSLRLPTRAALAYARDVPEGDGPSLGALPALPAPEAPRAEKTSKRAPNEADAESSKKTAAKTDAGEKSAKTAQSEQRAETSDKTSAKPAVKASSRATAKKSATTKSSTEKSSTEKSSTEKSSAAKAGAKKAAAKKGSAKASTSAGDEREASKKAPHTTPKQHAPAKKGRRVHD